MVGIRDRARISLKLGDDSPLDAPDSWWDSDEYIEPPPSRSWAHQAARGIVGDLRMRQGFFFDSIDEETRVDIIEMMVAIIHEAYSAEYLTIWQMIDELWHRYAEWFWPSLHYRFCMWRHKDSVYTEGGRKDDEKDGI